MTLTRARIVLLLAALVFLPRLLLAWFMGVAGDPEIWEYDVIGACIHAGLGHIYEINGLRYLAYAPPVWSYILAGLMSLPGESRGWIQVTQAICCLGAALCGVAITRRIGGSRTAGVVCGALIALQPSLLYYSVMKSDPLPLNAFLIGLVALSGMGMLERPSARRAFGFGLVTAFAALSRGTPAVALPTLTFMLAVRWRRLAILPVVTAALAFGAGVAPWIARNAVVVGAPILTSTTGENLWRGNNPAATGGAFDAAGRSLSVASADPAMFPIAIREALATGTELERQKAFMSEAESFVLEHKAEAARLFLRKLRLLWWRLESSPEDYSPRSAETYEWLYRIELALAILGAWTLMRVRKAAVIDNRQFEVASLILLWVGLSILQAAFYVQGRHRFLLEPLLLVFTAAGATTLGAGLQPPSRGTNAGGRR